MEEIIYTLNDTYYMPCLSGDNVTSLCQALSDIDFLLCTSFYVEMLNIC